MYKKGFSTIEMLVALTISALVLSAVVLLTFGSQYLAEDSQASSEALSLASGLLAREEALSRKDFNLVVPSVAYATSSARVYTEMVGIQTESDYLTKEVTATVSWTGEHGNPQAVTLATAVADFENAAGAGTCNAEPSGNWAAPAITNSMQNFAQLVGDSATTSIYTLTGLDAYNGRLYVTASNSSSNKETFFIFDTSAANPVLLGKLDNDASDNTGLAAVTVANTTSGLYAFVASASSFARGQLQVIDINNPAAPRIAATYKISTSTVPTAGLGNAIFYKSGYVYLGLTKTSGAGDEFNIIDVHNPLRPAWVGGYRVGNDINALYIEGSYAYIASPNAQNLLALNISNPANPVAVGSYTPTGGSNGKALAMVGDSLYLGRTFGTNELYILNAVNPAQLSLLGSKDLGSGSGTTVRGMFVRDSLLYLLTNGQFLIYNVGNPASPVPYAPALTLPNSASGAALECDNNTLYAAANDAASHGYLLVVGPSI